MKSLLLAASSLLTVQLVSCAEGTQPARTSAVDSIGNSTNQQANASNTNGSNVSAIQTPARRIVREAPQCAAFLGSCNFKSTRPNFVPVMNMDTMAKNAVANIASSGRMIVCQEYSALSYNGKCQDASIFSGELASAQSSCSNNGGVFSQSAKCAGISSGTEDIAVIGPVYLRTSVQLNNISAAEENALKSAFSAPASASNVWEVCTLVAGNVKCVKQY